MHDHITIKDLLETSSLGREGNEVKQEGYEPEGCPVCEKTARLFQTMKVALQGAFLPGAEATGTCPEEPDLFDAFEGRGDAAWRGPILNHAAGCACCFDRLAFYFKASEAMQSRAGALVELPSWLEERATQASFAPAASLRETMMRFFQDILLFLKSPVAGYCFAAVLLCVLLVGRPSSREPLINLSPSSQLTVVTPGQGGYGFQGGDEDSEKTLPLKGMTARSIGGGKILFSWPVIEGARETRFALFRIRKGRPTMLIDKKIRENRLAVDSGNLPKNSLYRWQLTGTLTGERKFYTSAEFVFFGRR